MRLTTAIVGGLVALAVSSCGCPASPCHDWVYVDLDRPTPWQAGTWSVVLTAEGLALDCTLTIPEDGWAPTLLDLACNDRVDRTAFVVDTGLWDGAERLRLRVPLEAEVDEEPTVARVVVQHTPVGDGAEAQVVGDGEIALPWRASRPQAGVCAEGCRVAEVVVRVPSVPD